MERVRKLPSSSELLTQLVRVLMIFFVGGLAAFSCRDISRSGCAWLQLQENAEKRFAESLTRGKAAETELEQYKASLW